MPCFRVYLTSGLMEEFGCTQDSLDWYGEPTGPNYGQDYIASWLDVLRNDKRAIFQAAATAQRATDYLHTLQQSEGPIAAYQPIQKIA